jgi:hypothetical protein
MSDTKAEQDRLMALRSQHHRESNAAAAELARLRAAVAEESRDRLRACSLLCSLVKRAGQVRQRGAARRGSVTSGSVTSGSVTSGSVTSGSVTSGSVTSV